MKKFTSSLALACAALLMASCGGPQAQTAEFTATEKGVGPVSLDLAVAEVPASSEGLYDAFATETIEDYEGEYTILKFTLDGAPVMIANVFDGGVIGSIEVTDPRIGSAGGIAPGSAVKDLLKAGGKPRQRNDGAFFISLGGLDFEVSGLKEAARMKLDDGYANADSKLMIDEKDFENGAKVERILIYN